MFKFILTKLHLNNIIYKASKCCCQKADSFIGYEEAIKMLYGYSKDSHGSCITRHDFRNTDCDVEIIVPCYNVEKYVEECISSIISQKTKYSFFVTIINDGSTDNTGKLLEKYEGQNGIKVINQQNKGFSGARNTGISQAHGRYLLFVDSDDVLLPNAVENLMFLAEKTNADVVDSGHIRFADNTNGGGKFKNFTV